MIIFQAPQNTDEWLENRKGKISGSKLKDIVVKRGTGRKIGFYQLLADKLAIDEQVDNPMERGSQLENEALDLFSKEASKKIEQVGLCVSDENPNIALSPDGLIKKGKKYPEAVEVKCLNSAKHLEAFFEKKIPVEYHEQAMQYFIVNENLETLYFVFYDPRIIVKPIHWIEVKRKDIEDEIQYLKDYQIQTLKEVEELLVSLAF